LSCFRRTVPLALLARSREAGFPLDQLAGPPSWAEAGRAPRLRTGPELGGEGGQWAVRHDRAVGLPQRAAVAGRASLEHAPPHGPEARERAQGDCPPWAHGRGRAIGGIAAAASALLRGPSGPVSGPHRRRQSPAPVLPRGARMGPPTLALAPCSLPSLLARPIGDARLAECAHRRWQQEKHTNTLSVPCNAKGNPCVSTLLEGAPRGGAHVEAGQPELHGREKGIVVSMAPAGPPAGADLQFPPGSSGAQHARKRTRTSIAQRVVPTKPELCKANEGMTHAHARATRTAAKPHHRHRPACRWQRAP